MGTFLYERRTVLNFQIFSYIEILFSLYQIEDDDSYKLSILMSITASNLRTFCSCLERHGLVCRSNGRHLKTSKKQSYQSRPVFYTYSKFYGDGSKDGTVLFLLFHRERTFLSRSYLKKQFLFAQDGNTFFLQTVFFSSVVVCMSYFVVI